MRLLLALFLLLGALRDARTTTVSVGPDVKGVGVGLPDLSLPLSLPVTVQLVASDTGACWESALASATRNTAT